MPAKRLERPRKRGFLAGAGRPPRLRQRLRLAPASLEAAFPLARQCGQSYQLISEAKPLKCAKVSPESRARTPRLTPERTSGAPLRRLVHGAIDASLRPCLLATGGQANVEELYRLLNAEEAARFLGLAEASVRDMTYRHELPHTKIGVRGVRYRLLDLIAWSAERSHPAAV